METSSLRQRAKRKLIRVTFPDGKVICYGNVTDTFIAVLREIGSERFPDIKLELCHLPMLTREVYPRYKEWIKPVCDGWYFNAQSNTDQKYIQLRSISDSLNLGLNVEIGEDFEKQDNPNKACGTKSRGKLMVRFSDGEYIANQNTLDTFLECLWKMGIDDIMRKGIEWGGKPLITSYKVSNRQVQVDTNRWAIIPNTTKDKAKLLRVLAVHLRFNIEITII
ncbi:hypothetical protein [uncultured Duncaniella sp.]|uniref:hypothetical protein n=1 Tax=uncultured Duncaniella sp. TaxID=2768039 RepID=UPI0025E8ADD3|nr:hypothetical protein [uncultured Duncaniella sp.]